jgi:regulator of PEP synthase PpsR (kinase-PPPase family)
MTGPENQNTLEHVKVIIISDGTGETATHIVRAIMTQFTGHNNEVFFTRYKNVRTIERLDFIFQEAAIHHDLIVYTMVTEEMRAAIQDLTMKHGVKAIDVLGTALKEFSMFFNQVPSQRPGLLHAVDDNYFKRVAAMEFTLNHDDGKNLDTLEAADVILVGVSRTSKTPLSVYLSQHGLKVVNIPLIPGTMLSEHLFTVDQRKIFALTIDADALIEIRKNRVQKLDHSNMNGGGEYAKAENVHSEIEWANNLFKENKRWPVFNVTNKAIEETAAEILRLIKMRSVNQFKQGKTT